MDIVLNGHDEAVSDPQEIWDDHPANQESLDERLSLEERLSVPESSDDPTSASSVMDETPGAGPSDMGPPAPRMAAAHRAARRRQALPRMALGSPEMRRRAQVARNRRAEDRENEVPVPVRPGTPRLRLISSDEE